jgi:hypothetical protein
MQHPHNTFVVTICKKTMQLLKHIWSKKVRMQDITIGCSKSQRNFNTIYETQKLLTITRENNFVAYVTATDSQKYSTCHTCV